MKKTILALLVSTACCALFSEVKADTINLFGVANSSNDSQLNPAGPTSITFNPGWTVFQGNGIFAGTNGNGPVAMATVTFTGNGSPVVCTTCPEVQWSFTGGPGGTHTYSFTLQALNSASTAGGAIAMNGVGFATVDGVSYSGTWSINGQSGQNFSFITSSAVPDGGSAVALLGVALTGIEGVRRVIRRRRA